MNYKKYVFNVIFLFGILQMNSQNQDKTYIKGNALSILLAVPNVGIETSIGKKTTFQVDVLASFWKSINGTPYKFVTLTPEFRYHFNEKFKGFYAGAHIGGSVFKVAKNSFYRELGLYQEGLGYMIGLTLGYQKKINDKIILDFFMGGGSHQSFYKGYNMNTGLRVEDAEKYNKSGEWLPYRGGVMISYKLN